MNDVCRINAKVKHRGWKYTGIVVDFPFEYSRLDYIMVQWDRESEPSEAWLPSLMLIEDEEEEFDWDEDT
jgi:heat shock protein HspQ